jgi:hypothetical protein
MKWYNNRFLVYCVLFSQNILLNNTTHITFWGMGKEGEDVSGMVQEGKVCNDW